MRDSVCEHQVSYWVRVCVYVSVHKCVCLCFYESIFVRDVWVRVCECWCVCGGVGVCEWKLLVTRVYLSKIGRSSNKANSLILFFFCEKKGLFRKPRSNSFCDTLLLIVLFMYWLSWDPYQWDWNCDSLKFNLRFWLVEIIDNFFC